MSDENTKEQIVGCVHDLVSNLLYYDRKEDPDLPRGAIQDVISRGVISTEEIVIHFRKALLKGLGK